MNRRSFLKGLGALLAASGMPAIAIPIEPIPDSDVLPVDPIAESTEPSLVVVAQECIRLKGVGVWCPTGASLFWRAPLGVEIVFLPGSETEWDVSGGDSYWQVEIRRAGDERPVLKWAFNEEPQSIILDVIGMDGRQRIRRIDLATGVLEEQEAWAPGYTPDYSKIAASNFVTEWEWEE